MSCGVGAGLVVVCSLVSCAIVLMFLKVTLTFVFLNRLVTFLTCGEECVKEAHFVSFAGFVGLYGWLCFFFCVICLNFVIKWMGMLLLCAVRFMFLRSFCRCMSLRGSESILFMRVASSWYILSIDT